ncbi:CgeB family protein [Guptibacillus spartinae]|uniref:CgeB family protein n=1 Tax=Guptibacillus spartinae TaxID=3025679 RepID=UPI00236085A8|nr:DUF3880 domain-containing protein [Pseudalkalibacillus spartinae]
MKVFYISSGFQGIYNDIDQKIIKSIQECKHECSTASLFSGLNHIKTEIMSFKPALILTTVGYTFPPQLRNWIYDRDLPIAVWLTEDPYYIDLTLPIIHKYNYVFTIDTAAYERYIEMDHKQVYYLPLGTDSEINRNMTKEAEYTSDICFIGSPYPNRIESIKYLLDHSNYKMIIAGPHWEEILKDYSHRSNLTIVSWIPPKLAAHYFSNAKINLNIHRPFDLKANANSNGVIPKSVNNRTFDIAACQSFQLITPILTLPPHLENTKDILFFETNQELLDKVNDYVKNDHLRETMAKNARNNVLEHYTITRSLEKIFDIVEQKED